MQANALIVRVRRLAIGPSLAAAGLAMSLLTGCSGLRAGGDGQTPDQVIHELRSDNEQLRKEVDRLESEVAARVAQLDADPARAQPAGVKPSDLPAVGAIQFGLYSGFIDTDNDGADDQLRVYLQTVDQKGRFLPAAGSAVLQAAVIEPGAAPQLIVDQTFDPKAFDGSFRSGFLGTHYTLEAPLMRQVARPTDLAVKVTFTDAATGVTVAQQQSMPIR